MRIKELRNELNLTQLDLAKAINTSQRNISRWENEENEPTASFLAALAEFFNVSVSYLLGSEEEEILFMPEKSSPQKNEGTMLRIKELRFEKKLTQKELAAEIGVNQTAIGKYERKELEPNLETLSKLADFFGCSTDFLIGRSDDFGNVTVTNGAGEQLTDGERAMLANYRRLNKLNRMHADSYILVRLENQEESASNRRG